MGLAFEVASAISEAVNSLCALLEWNDGGAGDVPPVDGAMLQETMAALERAMREVLHGGRVEAGRLPITEGDLARVAQLGGLIPGWSSRGALPSEVVALAEESVSALCGGTSWRELMAAARR